MNKWTKDRITEIWNRCNKATPAPWRLVCDLQTLECAEEENLITFDDRMRNQEDADFIANSRSDIPFLLEEFERMQRELTVCTLALSDISCMDEQVAGAARVMKNMANNMLRRLK